MIAGTTTHPPAAVRREQYGGHTAGACCRSSGALYWRTAICTGDGACVLVSIYQLVLQVLVDELKTKTHKDASVTTNRHMRDRTFRC